MNLQTLSGDKLKATLKDLNWDAKIIDGSIKELHIGGVVLTAGWDSFKLAVPATKTHDKYKIEHELADVKCDKIFDTYEAAQEFAKEAFPYGKYEIKDTTIETLDN